MWSNHNPVILSCSATVGEFVSLIVFIARPVTELVRANVDQAILLAAAQHTGIKKTLRHFWEEGYNIKLEVHESRESSSPALRELIYASADASAGASRRALRIRLAAVSVGFAPTDFQ